MNWEAFEHGWFPVSSLSLYPGIPPEPSSKKRFLHESFTLSNSAADTISARHPLVLCSSTVLHQICPQNLFYPEWYTAHHDWNSLIPERAKWEMANSSRKRNYILEMESGCAGVSHIRIEFSQVPAGFMGCTCRRKKSFVWCWELPAQVPLCGQVIWIIIVR